MAADYAERLFMQYTGSQREKAIEDLNNTIKILKFYSNNDFAFKDVHNEELFFQNGKILVEVVQLFQPYRIIYPSKHQFLGDLFEQLLNKGFKQNEGQFFTPTPITRFIWDALPLTNYISLHGLPNVIDYACGAGHFLTEAVEAINAVRHDNDNSWVEKHIFGVEKDYRLARVSKVSLFMNGAGGANVIFGDGLENYEEKGIGAGRFDILVANPPYSVNGFKQHLKLRNNSFRIFDIITNDGGEIETLFIERIAQLLRPQGIAAVILPASFLSNSSSTYTAAREELLKNFLIRAIVSLGNKTFGATGTNTVTLFLERYNEPPRIAELAQDTVTAIMQGGNIENFTDKQVLSDYLDMQGIEEEQYRALLKKEIDMDKASQVPYFRPYANTFSTKPMSFPRNCSDEEKNKIRQERFYEYCLATEREKLYYFALAHTQRTLVITSPTDNNEQKEFLGYDWSNRKGAEGIVINIPGGKMFDDKDRFAQNTLASAIRNTFIGADITTDLPEEIRKYTKTYWLKDMIDFARSKFELDISLNAGQGVELISKYPLVKLGGEKGVCKILIGGTPSRKNYSYYKGGNNLWVSISEMNGQTITDTKEKITDVAVKNSNVKLIPSGTTLLSFKLSIGKTAIAGKDLYTNEAIAALIPNNKDEICDKYLFYLFNGKIIDLSATGNKAFGKSLNSTYLNENVNIPLPPLDIQQQIVTECEAIDKAYDSIQPEYYVSTDNLLQNCEGVVPYDGTPEVDSIVEYKKGDILISNIRPYLKKIWMADKDGGCSADVLVLRRIRHDYDSEFVY